MISNLIFVFLLTMIIHAAETLSYSIRYAGVKLNKIAVALSLTGIVVLVSRTANKIHAPLTAKRLHHSLQRLGKIYILLMGARFIGTLIAQLILVPAACVIGFMIQLI